MQGYTDLVWTERKSKSGLEVSAAMAQGDYIELAQKRHGKRFDHEEKKRKKEARSGHRRSAIAKTVRGLKAKQYNKKRYSEKAVMKKTIKQHQERLNKHKTAETPDEKDAVPAYLLDREGMSHAKVLSNSIKQKRKEKAGKWSVPIPKVPTEQLPCVPTTFMGYRCSAAAPAARSLV